MVLSEEWTTLQGERSAEGNWRVEHELDFAGGNSPEERRFELEASW